jgi:cbb3-type cytochrome oxidase maturation protein
MEVIYGLLPGMLLLGVIGVAVFFWAVRSGQYDDMDGAANRILMDDEPMQSETDNNTQNNLNDQDNDE